jgi:hypothetical protein
VLAGAARRIAMLLIVGVLLSEVTRPGD